MRDGVILSPRSTQPQITPCIDPNSPFARGLAFFAPMSPAAPSRDLVSGVRATVTGGVNAVSTRSGQVLREFGTSKFLDFNRKPVGIGTTTPTTIAWTQEARGTAAFSTVLKLQVGTAGSDPAFMIYQAASDANYYFTAGPTQSLGAHTWNATGALTNNVLDVFVLIAASGLNSTLLTTWTLYRNKLLVARGVSTSFSANTTDGFRVGARDTGTDPFEGGIGNLGIWSRMWSEAEIISWTENQNQLFPPQQRRIWVPVAAASPGSTGTLATTNANDTLAASGTTTVVGTLARTNADDSCAASGTVGAMGSTGTLDYTNAADTSASSGTTTVVGTLARTNANDTSTSVGTTTVLGTLSYTNASDSLVASGSGSNAVVAVGLRQGFDVRYTGHTVPKPTAGLWWQRKPRDVSDEDADEKVAAVAAAVDAVVAEQLAEGKPASKAEAKKAVKAAIADMPGFDWNAFYQRAYALAAEQAAQQAEHAAKLVSASQHAHMVLAVRAAVAAREEDDDEAAVLALMV